MDVTPPRILYLVTLGTWGGAQRYVFDMATAAKEAGHEVLVVTGPGRLANRLEASGVPTHVTTHFRRGIQIRAEIASFQALLTVIRTFKPDVVHANSSKAGVLGILAARLSGVRRTIFTAHGWAFTEQRPWFQKSIFWVGYYLTIMLADYTICVSQGIKEGTRRMPFVRSKISLIYNGVELAPLLTREAARAHLAPNVSLPFWIGTVAELHPNKHLDLLIEAFALITHDYPDVYLAIIGEGSERERLEQLITTHDLKDRIALCGHQEPAIQYLSAFDIFVLPSRTEALGYVLLEAGLARLPVVASAVGGIPEVIRHEETGLLFPSGDTGALTAALTRYLDDPGLREHMGNALYEHVTKHFSKERMVRKTLAQYT